MPSIFKPAPPDWKDMLYPQLIPHPHLLPLPPSITISTSISLTPCLYPHPSHPYQLPQNILLIVSSNHIIVGRGGPSTLLKNPLLVCNHQLPYKSNSSYKNFWNPKITRSSTKMFFMWHCDYLLCYLKKKSRSNKWRLWIKRSLIEVH